MTFPRNFKRLRKKAGKTQQQIADLFGISRNSISNWEDEKGDPKYPETSRLPDIAAFLQCRVGDFFDDASERNGFADAIQAEQDLDAYALLDQALRRLLIVGKAKDAIVAMVKEKATDAEDMSKLMKELRQHGN